MARHLKGRAVDIGEDVNRLRSTTDVIRLADVAREAGVAIATASRALSNPSRVNVKTRVRVLKAAERLGYATNIAARSLRSGLSRIVLVIMPPWEGFNVLEPALRGIDAELMRAGYSMIVGALARDRSADPRIIEMARGGFVDGILAITNDPPQSGELPILSARLPAVGLLIDLSPFGVPSVVVAEREGTRLLAEHLIAQGRRRLMYVSGPPGYHDIERLAGFEDAIRAASRPVSTVHVEGDYTASAGVRAAEAFLAMPDRPDGAVFTNDRMAVAFMDVVRRAGVRIPADLSVTGFDDIEGATYCEPPLTTYRQPMELMGAEATRLLLRLIGGEAVVKAGRTMFAGEIVVRGSS
jgi:LacI family repressor for deo operon, udp, cdd, tsx, nupC, and nupG